MSELPQISYTYSVGETVEIWDRGPWRRALITKLAPYRGKPGYYMQWETKPYSDGERRRSDLPMPSSGGWTYENIMRKVAS